MSSHLWYDVLSVMYIELVNGGAFWGARNTTDVVVNKTKKERDLVVL
jgi:hypothetical protein